MEENPWSDLSQQKLSFKAAMKKIFLSTALISGTAAVSLLGYFHVKALKQSDASYSIKYLIQSKDSDKVLSTSYLAELLNVSFDKPTNLVDFDVQWGRRKLLASPVIHEAKVTKVSPNALLVQYQARKALFHLMDFSNAALDKAGVIFPIKPFFSGHQLPELYIGNLLSSTHWGDKLPQRKLQVAFSLFKAVKDHPIQGLELKRIDVSQAFSLSLGERQIVLIFTDVAADITWVLRLRTTDFLTQLKHFSLVVNHLKGNNTSKIVDLRLEKLAFLSDF